MKHINKKWFSLIIAIWLVIVMTLIATLILDFAIPFSKNIKWIENASNSYYQVNSWFEDAVFFISKNILWSETWKTMSNTINTDFWYKITASWSKSPTAWKWNSDFDPDWNKISEWNSIQMEVWSNKINNWPLTSKSRIYFRVPNLDWNWWLTLSWWNTLPIINWKLSWENSSLDASSWSQFKASQTCKSATLNNTDCINLWIPLIFDNNLKWSYLDINWIEQQTDFKSFYDANCKNLSWCILKLSVINSLILSTNNTKIPYLEWKLDFWNNTIPSRYAEIEASGKSNWFKKYIDFSVPQKTGIDTFDFTIFQ